MFLLRKQSHMLKGFPGYLCNKNNSLHNSHVIAVSHAFTSKAFFFFLNMSTLSPVQFILTSRGFPEAQRLTWTTALPQGTSMLIHQPPPHFPGEQNRITQKIGLQSLKNSQLSP